MQMRKTECVEHGAQLRIRVLTRARRDITGQFPSFPLFS